MKWLVNTLMILLGTLAGTALSLIIKTLISDFPAVQATFIAFLCVSLIVFLQQSRGKYLGASIKSIRLAVPEIIREEAREGLIVFLPLYKRFATRGFPDQGKKYAMEIEDALRNCNYVPLGFDDISATNFGHATLAIITHLEKLKYCWLVTTRSMRNHGQSSEDFVDVYKKFLKEKVTKGKVTFLSTPPIDIDDEAAICRQVSDKVQQIFREARRKYKLKPQNIIVDVTPGNKSMTVGAVLGAMSKEKDIQIIVASRYEGERPVDLVPVIIKYEPRIIPE